MRCDAATCRPTTRPCAPRPEPYISKLQDLEMDMEGRKGSVVEEINCAAGMRKKKKQRTSEFMPPCHLQVCICASKCLLACCCESTSETSISGGKPTACLRVCVSACLHLAAYPHPILSSSTRWGMVDAADTKSVLNRSANPGPGSLHAWQAGRWHRRPLAGPPGACSLAATPFPFPLCTAASPQRGWPYCTALHDISPIPAHLHLHPLQARHTLLAPTSPRRGNGTPVAQSNRPRLASANCVVPRWRAARVPRPLWAASSDSLTMKPPAEAQKDAAPTGSRPSQTTASLLHLQDTVVRRPRRCSEPPSLLTASSQLTTLGRSPSTPHDRLTQPSVLAPRSHGRQSSMFPCC